MEIVSRRIWITRNGARIVSGYVPTTNPVTLGDPVSMNLLPSAIPDSITVLSGEKIPLEFNYKPTGIQESTVLKSGIVYTGRLEVQKPEFVVLSQGCQLVTIYHPDSVLNPCVSNVLTINCGICEASVAYSLTGIRGIIQAKGIINSGFNSMNLFLTAIIDNRTGLQVCFNSIAVDGLFLNAGLNQTIQLGNNLIAISRIDSIPLKFAYIANTQDSMVRKGYLYKTPLDLPEHDLFLITEEGMQLEPKIQMLSSTKETQIVAVGSVTADVSNSSVSTISADRITIKLSLRNNTNRNVIVNVYTRSPPPRPQQQCEFPYLYLEGEIVNTIEIGPLASFQRTCVLAL